MSSKPKYGVITSWMSQSQNRFRKYNAPLPLEEKFKMMNSLENVDGVELVYPYEERDAPIIRNMLKKNDLSMAAVKDNIKSEDDFIHGSIPHPDKAVRLIKEAK